MGLCFLILSTASVVAQPRALPPGLAVAQQNLRLRVGPAPSARVVSSVMAGYPVRLLACQRGWCEVEYMGVRGYARAGLLQSQPSLEARALPEAALPREPDAGAPPTEGGGPALTPPPVEPASVHPAAALSASVPLPELRLPPAPSDSEGEGLRASVDSPASIDPPATAAVEPVDVSCITALREAHVKHAEGALREAAALLARCIVALGTEGPATDALLEETMAAYRALARDGLYEDGLTEAEAAPLSARQPGDGADAPSADAVPAPPGRARGRSSVAEPLPTADSPCAATLAQAHAHYEAGSFGRAVETIGGCLDSTTLDEAEAIQMHRLLALAYLKQGYIAAARGAVTSVLRLDPEYRADPVRDIPVYEALVSLVRQHGPSVAPPR